MRRVIIYHTDGDGYCSAAIIAALHGWRVSLYPMSYLPGEEPPWDEINENTECWVVDYAFQPFDLMAQLRSRAGSLLWIDHHQTAIDSCSKWEQENQLEFYGIQLVGQAACELTWQFLHATPPPLTVSLLGRYDVWDHAAHPHTVEYNAGLMATPGADPRDRDGRALWECLLGHNDAVRKPLEQSITMLGSALLRERERRMRTMRSACYQIEFDGHLFICANIGGVNSAFFCSEPLLSQYPDAEACLSYRYEDGRWLVRLYGLPERVCPNLGEIALRYGADPTSGLGGGGHAGAAGFSWRGPLPF